MLRLFSVVLVLIGVAAPAAAQDKAKDVLTNNNLKTVLEDMGLDPTELAKGLCQITLVRNDYRAGIRVIVGNDGRQVYLASNGVTIFRPAEMPADFWRRL